MTNKEQYEKLVAENKNKITPEFILACIEDARQRVKTGELTVEKFYQTKKILIETLEPANEWTH
jgi:hypothetical protein